MIHISHIHGDGEAIGARVAESIYFTLWLFNIAMENGLSIDGLPIKNGDFHGYVK